MSKHPVIDMKNTGKRLEELRRQRGYSIDQLREILVMESYQGVRKWERGESLPMVDTLIELCLLYQTPLEYILILQSPEDNERFHAILNIGGSVTTARASNFV